MANPEHLAILKQGVAVWNEWRRKNPSITPELKGETLAGMNLARSNLIDANLEGVSFEEANLAGTDLLRAYMLAADLNRTNLNQARLAQANLTVASLIGAYLVKADLTLATLVRSNLSYADVSQCKLNLTTFGDVDLSMVRGLDTIIHEGPSIIGIDTIYLSKGKVSEVFLHGCGVPDTFIEFSRSLVGKPIEFYSCFISHSGKDKQFCERLYADLQANGVRVWYFPEDAKWGEPVWGEIDRRIKIYDKLVVVCSENSLQSGPVLREIERALRREDEEGKNILFPITIDNCLFEKWEHPRKADVLAKVVGDFRGWDRSAEKYDAAFKKLLKALKPEGAPSR